MNVSTRGWPASAGIQVGSYPVAALEEAENIRSDRLPRRGDEQKQLSACFIVTLTSGPYISHAKSENNLRKTDQKPAENYPLSGTGRGRDSRCFWVGEEEEGISQPVVLTRRGIRKQKKLAA